MLKIHQKIYKKPLFVFALESEAGIEFHNEEKLFIGVGKINAAYNLMKALQQTQPDIVINLGTAGSTTFKRGEVVNCTQFIQRDMEVMALGFKKFETPFENAPIILTHGLKVPNIPQGICGSGDQFEMEHKNDEYNVIDMEAYALAKVCQLENIDFLCLKYISDGADGNAVNDWNTEVKLASKKLREVFNNIK